MKKFLFIVALSFLCSALFAQGTKFPLLIHFTNTKCGSCAGNNPGFYSKLTPYLNKSVHHLSVHPSNPYSGCALYQANITDNTALSTQYSTPFTPSFSFNGKSPASVTQLTDAQLKTAAAEKSPITMKVTETTGATRSVTATIKTVGTLPAGSYVVYAAIVEKKLNYTGSNGEAVHYDVLRKLASATTGDAITLAALNQSKSVSYTYAVDAKWNAAETYMLVWVQEKTSLAILNSGASFDPASTDVADILTDEKISVFPNPAQDVLTLDLTNVTSTVKSVEIIHIDGRIIRKENARNTINTLTISDLQSGDYVLKIVTDKGIVTRIFQKI